MTSDTSRWIGMLLWPLWLVGWPAVFFVRFRFRKHRSILGSIFFSIILTFVALWISADICDIAFVLGESEVFLSRALSIYLWGLVLVATYVLLVEWWVRAQMKKRKEASLDGPRVAP